MAFMATMFQRVRLSTENFKPQTTTEGAGRETKPDQRRFYVIARGSLRECQAIFQIAEVNNPELDKNADCLGASLYRLIQSREG